MRASIRASWIAVAVLVGSITETPGQIAVPGASRNSTVQDSISFSLRLGNQHFATNFVTGRFEVFSGVPTQWTVLVESDDAADAVWRPYTGSIGFPLEPSDGEYEVVFGLRANPNSPAKWFGTHVVLDRLPPVVVITSPDSTNVSQPMIQVQGYATEEIASIEYDLQNDSGFETGIRGQTRRKEYDEDSVVTNWFQCFDVGLTNGLNILTLRVSDKAGNSTTKTMNYVLDYSLDSVSPAISIIWPPRGYIGGSNITVRGRVDDETAKVVARITGAGQTHTMDALVERDGKVWVEDVPISEGTNFVTLTATDAAGNSAVTNLTLVRSPVNVTIDKVPEDQLNQRNVDVTGRVSNTGYKVWVNGVAATVYTDGRWRATNVPVTSGGTAVFSVTAIPLWDNNGNGTPPTTTSTPQGR